MEANFIDVDFIEEDVNEVDSFNETFQSTDEGPEPSLDILGHLHELYKNKLAMIRTNCKRDKLRMENRLLHSWVQDVVQQNKLLVIAVKTLETKALDRIQKEQQHRLEQRQHSEIVSELKAEKAILQQKLAHKDSDIRGLVEVLRRLREHDDWSVEGIHFFHLTESDIFGSTEWRKQKDCGDENETQKIKKRQRDPLADTNELKIMNDALEKENKAKDREIRKLNEDLQELRSQVSEQSQPTCVGGTRDIGESTNLCCPLSQCGDVGPVRDYSALLKEESDKCEAKITQLEDSLKSNVESHRLLRENNVQLLEEVATLRRVCCTLNEQCRAQSSRAQFKDDIIMEMRKQLKQAKAKLKEEAAALSNIRCPRKTTAELSTCNVRPHTDRPDTKLPIAKLDRGDASRTTCTRKMSRVRNGDGDTMSTKSSK